MKRDGPNTTPRLRGMGMRARGGSKWRECLPVAPAEGPQGAGGVHGKAQPAAWQTAAV